MVVGGVTTAIGPFLGWVGDETVVDGGFPALAKAEKRAQNGRLPTSVRRSITPLYRAAFGCRNRPRNPAAGVSPMTTTADPQIVPRPPAFLPALRAADQGVASALESVLSENTHRVYGA